MKADGGKIGCQDEEETLLTMPAIISPTELSSAYHARERHLTEALAVGDHAWLEGVHKKLGLKHKRILPASPSVSGEAPKSIHDGRAAFYIES